LIGLSNKYIFDPFTQKYGGMSVTKIIIFVTILIGLILIFMLVRKRITGSSEGKISKFIRGFLEGLLSIRKMKKFWTFAFLSVLIWAMYFYSTLVCLNALPETKVIGHKECLTIMLFGTLGVVFSPGGLGAYHLIVAGILTFYGIAEAPSIAIPWLVWTASFIMISFFGLLSIILLPIINKKRNVVQQ
jgi:uncharacterized membrane protein YbhN (UPF0104 family)